MSNRYDRLPLGEHASPVDETPSNPGKRTLTQGLGPSIDRVADRVASVLEHRAGNGAIARDDGPVGRIHDAPGALAAPTSAATPALDAFDFGFGQITGSHQPTCGCVGCVAGRIGNGGTDDADKKPVGMDQPPPDAPVLPVPVIPVPVIVPQQPQPQIPAPPTITSATSLAAPSGAANTRTRIGVGEQVVFTGSAAGTWAATAGAPGAGLAAPTFTWTAPAVAGAVTITLTVNGVNATLAMDVVAPTTVAMANAGAHGGIGPGGACMLCSITVNPLDVCLGATQIFEVPGPATNITGFFTKYDAATTLFHNPSPHYAAIGNTNMVGGQDHVAWHTTAGPYSDGTFQWDVPWRYKLDGEADGDGRLFTTITQLFTMTAAGNLTITKAGAST